MLAITIYAMYLTCLHTYMHIAMFLYSKCSYVHMCKKPSEYTYTNFHALNIFSKYWCVCRGQAL